MALVPCRECGHKVSNEANSWLFDWKTRHCPNCDCRNPTQDSHHSYSVFGSNLARQLGQIPFWVWVVVIIVVVAVFLGPLLFMLLMG